VTIGEHMRQAGALAEAAGLPCARDAMAVRRWDDEAKDPAITPPGFAYFAPLLESLAGR
jgi:gamma-butyrobetaine dioxygenase